MNERVNRFSKPQLARKCRLRYDEVREADLLLLPERVVKLNATGAAILRLCDGRRSIQDIVQELEARYKQTGLESDITEFLENASAQGWLK